MGADVTLVGPPTLIPPDAPVWGVHVSYDIDAVLQKLDVCYVLRVQKERQRLEFFPSVREYSRFFGLTRERVQLMPDEALIYMRYEGIVAGDALPRILGGEAVPPADYYFRTTPYFETSSDKYAWLNKIVAVGVGQADLSKGWVGYQFYEVG